MEDRQSLKLWISSNQRSFFYALSLKTLNQKFFLMRTKNEKRFNFNVQFIAGLNVLKSIFNKDKNKEEV